MSYHVVCYLLLVLFSSCFDMYVCMYVFVGDVLSRLYGRTVVFVFRTRDCNCDCDCDCDCDYDIFYLYHGQYLHNDSQQKTTNDKRQTTTAITITTITTILTDDFVSHQSHRFFPLEKKNKSRLLVIFHFVLFQNQRRAFHR